MKSENSPSIHSPTLIEGNHPTPSGHPSLVTEGSCCESQLPENSCENPPPKSSPPVKGESAEGGRGSVFPINNLPFLRTFRKELRNRLTPAEAKLWTLIKNSQLDGRKFRRQHSVGRYILDFYCPSERLAIELDGAGHFTESGQEYDRERDLFLNYFGIMVLRFENRLVFQQTEAVLMEIRKHFGWFKETTQPETASPETASLQDTLPLSRRGIV